MCKKFSVCMSVYRNDKPEDFLTAVRSIYNQTMPPSEIILVVDGPIPETVNKAISTLQGEIPVMKVIRLEQNRGHAIARQTGIEAAKYNYVAVMDSDDIAIPERFEKQLNYLEDHPGTDVIGGQIDEFIDNIDNVVGSRIVPLKDKEIKEYVKSRCPMNLVTVMLNKDSVQKVGGYIDWYCEEDYYLWIRMVLSEMHFANLPDVLVKVRVGSEMYQRRGGMRYFKSEVGIQKLMLENNLISWPRYAYNVFGRWCIQVAMPNWLRGFVFRIMFRK